MLGDWAAEDLCDSRGSAQRGKVKNMLWTGRGKVNIATAGTPVSLATGATTLKVNMIIVTYDPADATAVVYVKDRSGAIMAAMGGSSNAPIVFTAPGSNQLDLRDFQIDSGTNNKGPYVAIGTD